MHQPCTAFPNARHGAHTSRPLPLVHNTASAPNARRERERWSAQLAALQAGLERAQRASADARAEAGRAGAAAQRCEAELGNARKQATALRERVKDLEQQQRARPPAPPRPAARDVRAPAHQLGAPATGACYPTKHRTTLPRTGLYSCGQWCQAPVRPGAPPVWPR